MQASDAVPLKPMEQLNERDLSLGIKLLVPTSNV